MYVCMCFASTIFIYYIYYSYYYYYYNIQYMNPITRLCNKFKSKQTKATSNRLVPPSISVPEYNTYD